MKRPSFIEGAGVALLLAVAAGIGLPGLTWLLGAGTAARALTALLALAYLIYLLGRSSERAGRAVVLVLWTLIAALLWISGLPLSIYLLAHLALAWLVRVLYFHPGPLAALADLGLTGAALVAAVGTYLHTESPALSVWCLFLVQALFVLIPVRARPGAADPQEDRFERAHRNAETAVRRLSADL